MSHQNDSITSKINICCLYYLLTQCDDYTITINRTQMNNTNEFLSVHKITKGNETIFDSQLLSDSSHSLNEQQKLETIVLYIME